MYDDRNGLVKRESNPTEKGEKLAETMSQSSERGWVTRDSAGLRNTDRSSRAVAGSQRGSWSKFMRARRFGLGNVWVLLPMVLQLCDSQGWPLSRRIDCVLVLFVSLALASWHTLNYSRVPLNKYILRTPQLPRDLSLSLDRCRTY